MKYFYLISISLMFTGCCYDSNGNLMRTSMFLLMDIDDLIELNFNRLSNLSVGLTKEQSLEIMGTENYSCIPSSLRNPASTEIIAENDRTIEVIHYRTLRNTDTQNDDCPPEEEFVIRSDGTLLGSVANTLGSLTPLVFENGKLIGWGKCFLRSISKEYDKRFISRGFIPWEPPKREYDEKSQ